MEHRMAAVVAACWLTFVASPPSALAQVDTGSVRGTVADQTGAAVPGVTITITSMTTGAVRTTVTNGVGRYQITALPPTTYSVKAELQSFQSVVRSPLTVNIGAIVDVNLTMIVGALTETVTVTGEAPLIQSTKTEMSSVINQEQLETLPSKSRQFLDFTLLLPATVDSVSINQQGAGFSLGGARASTSSLLVDGFYNMDEGFALPRQRYSQDSIQEFQVTSFGGSAEYGRAIGGIVNSVTKSGANDFRGTAYGFFKDANLNSNETGARLRGTPKTPYSRQQWGGSFGGPIKTSKLFFFGAYERAKEDYTMDNGITNANGAIIGLPAADIGSIPRYYRLNFAMAKVDYNVTENTHLQLGLAFSRWTEFNISSPQSYGAISRQMKLYATDLSYLFKLTKVAREGHQFHEFKFSYFPRNYGVTGLNGLDGPPLVPMGGNINPFPQTSANPPRVIISSVAAFGPSAISDEEKNYPVQAIYTSTLFAKKHTIKFGADYMYAFFDYSIYWGLNATYSFSSLANYLKGAYSQYTQSFGDPYMPRRHHYLSGFVQDTWQPTGRLTLNYGLRYDLEIQPMSSTGKRFGYDYNNFGPRFGASYDLTGKGTTFLKLSSGIYYDRIFQNLTQWWNTIKGYETLISATWTPSDPGAPVYPNVYTTQPANLPRKLINTNILPDNFAVPMSAQVTGTVEHAITPNIVVKASLVTSRAWHVNYRWDTNLAWDDAKQAWYRPDSNYRQILQYRWDTRESYVGGIFEIARRGKRFSINGSLTLNRARNTGNSYGNMPNDQRLGVAADYGPQADTPVARGVVSGFFNITPTIQVSAVFQARTGMAVNPIASGVDLNGDGVTGDRTPGFGRNSFRGPSFNQTDLRLTWKLPVRFANVQLYAESFNVFNRANVTGVNGDYGSTNGQPKSVWLAPTGYYPPRQAQLGARIAF
jgi:hypothetical protein